MNFHLDMLQTIALAIVVLFVGYFFNARVKLLKQYNIPEPVVGGMVFAVVTMILFMAAEFQLSFDMSMKDPLMLTFFTTVGLGASLKLLKQGGPKVGLFIVIAGVYLILQNAVGLSLALATDQHPTLGLLGGSITLAGGHGTGATYAEKFANEMNVQGSMELAMACATFGLVLGGIIGGPVAQRLIKKHGLSSDEATKSAIGGVEEEDAITYDPRDADNVTPAKVLETLLIILVCIIIGGFIVTWFKSQEIAVPSFICSLLIGIVITNTCEFTGIYTISKPCVDLLGTIGLSLFLAMALMSLRLWELANLAGPMLLIMIAQTTCLALFAYFITFRIMGKDYDAAIMAGGHCGFGMGATPTAVANMEALTSRYGPSSTAFLVVTMVGAFFIDIVNAAVITGYLALPFYTL